MFYYVKVTDGRVTDRAIFDTPMSHEWPDKDDWHQNDLAQVGWSAIGDEFIAPHQPPDSEPEPAFRNLEPDQFWFVVRVSGYEPALKNWVSSMNDPEHENYNPITWAAASAKLEFAKFFERDHPLVEAAREAIGMSEAELDSLWEYAQ